VERRPGSGENIGERKREFPTKRRGIRGRIDKKKPVSRRLEINERERNQGTDVVFEREREHTFRKDTKE